MQNDIPNYIPVNAETKTYKFEKGQRVYYRKYGYKGFKLYGHVAENYTTTSPQGNIMHMVTIFIDELSEVVSLPESKLRLAEQE